MNFISMLSSDHNSFLRNESTFEFPRRHFRSMQFNQLIYSSASLEYMDQLQWLGIKSQQNRNKTTKHGNKERATRKTTFLHMSERGRKLIFSSKKKTSYLDGSL
uniref:Uncharacterized protein n=1 Tax=Cucumis sativus TaxID=3659 RepID=A0A0A0LNZ5_CUCSA